MVWVPQGSESCGVGKESDLQEVSGRLAELSLELSCKCNIPLTTGHSPITLRRRHGLEGCVQKPKDIFFFYGGLKSGFRSLLRFLLNESPDTGCQRWKILPRTNGTWLFLSMWQFDSFHKTHRDTSQAVNFQLHWSVTSHPVFTLLFPIDWSVIGKPFSYSFVTERAPAVLSYSLIPPGSGSSRPPFGTHTTPLIFDPLAFLLRTPCPQTPRCQGVYCICLTHTRTML